MTQLTPEVRDALEGTRILAEQALDVAQAKLNRYIALADEANDEVNAQQSIVNAINAALEDRTPVEDDKYKTFGED